MTQPARDNPRAQRQDPTSQLCVWIAEAVKAEVKATARARKEKLRVFVERALRRELERGMDAPAAAES